MLYYLAGIYCAVGPVFLHPANSNSSSSWYVVNVGGNYNNGTNAGLFYANYNTASNSNANIGSRLLVFLLHSIFLTAWWKYRRLGQDLVGFSRTVLQVNKEGML